MGRRAPRPVTVDREGSPISAADWPDPAVGHRQAGWSHRRPPGRAVQQPFGVFDALLRISVNRSRESFSLNSKRAYAQNQEGRESNSWPDRKRRPRIADLPGATVFEPAGVPARSLVEIVLTVDEFEALRLADYEGLYQKQAAERMGISRPTFGRIVEAARREVCVVLVEGGVLRIEGGVVAMPRIRSLTLRRVRSCLGPALRDWPPRTGARPAAHPDFFQTDVTDMGFP